MNEIAPPGQLDRWLPLEMFQVIDSIIRIIDRLIDLIDRKKKSDRLVFSDHVDPIFLDLSTIQRDYISSLREIEDIVAHSDILGLDLQSEMRRRQQACAPLRKKVVALAQVIMSSDLDEDTKHFAFAVLSYFSLASETETTGYSTLLDLIEWLSSEPGAKNRAAKSIADVQTNINDRWSDVTLAYARVRFSLLSP